MIKLAVLQIYGLEWHTCKTARLKLFRSVRVAIDAGRLFH